MSELPAFQKTASTTSTAPALGPPPMPGAGDKVAGAPNMPSVPPLPTSGAAVTPSTTGTPSAAQPPSIGNLGPPPLPLPPTTTEQEAMSIPPEKKNPMVPNGIVFPPNKVRARNGIEFPTAALPEVMIKGVRMKTWQAPLKRTVMPPLVHYNYRRQILPDSIYSKGYDRNNQHLPLAVYAEDYDREFLEAVANNNINATRALLNSGRNVNLRNAGGDTALILALRYGAIDTARLLVARGANPGLAGADGRTAYDVAAGMGMQRILPPMAASPVVYSRR